MAAVTCEIQWLNYLLHDLRVPFLTPSLIYCDNQAALHIAANPTFHEPTKHIELDCHVVREKLQAGLIRLLPIPSAAQIADLCTKALPPRSFSALFPKLGLLNIHSPA